MIGHRAGSAFRRRGDASDAQALFARLQWTLRLIESLCQISHISLDICERSWRATTLSD